MQIHPTGRHAGLSAPQAGFTLIELCATMAIAAIMATTAIGGFGDLIQKLTNDIYLANMHRGINTSGRERYSIPFCIDADFDAVIAPLPSCVTEANPQRYPPVTCGAHKFGRFVASYAHLKKPAA